MYKDWVVSEATNIKSDKCTFALDVHTWCCYEHDLACSYGKDPREAYRLYKEGFEDVWRLAAFIKRSEADKRFRLCLQEHSKLGKWSPMSWWRWVGVRIGAWL